MIGMMEIFINFILGKEFPIERINRWNLWLILSERWIYKTMPGKKDFISIGRNIHIQKRLILCNLKDLFTEFKTKFPNIKVRILSEYNFIHTILYICITYVYNYVQSGAYWQTHVERILCVFSIYQNAILLSDAVDIQDTYKELMSKLVCSVDSEIACHADPKWQSQKLSQITIEKKRFEGRIYWLVFNIIGLCISKCLLVTNRIHAMGKYQ